MITLRLSSRLHLRHCVARCRPMTQRTVRSLRHLESNLLSSLNSVPTSSNSRKCLWRPLYPSPPSIYDPSSQAITPRTRKLRTPPLGHVLICPKRSVARYSELTKEEVADLWLLTQEVGEKVERHYGAEALSLCIQDGPAAGQTVPHVHIHCLPRKKGDFDDNDEVYDRMEETSQARTKSRWF